MGVQSKLSEGVRRRLTALASAPAGQALVRARVLVVTAYYKEDRSLLERCLASVAAQTAAADHMLVADGFPQDWIDATGVRHIRLDRAHGDYGNTPRGVGALLAIAEGYDAICFLDADNWYEKNHVEACLTAARQAGRDCDYVVAKRNMCRPDETILPVEDEPIETHVDTNCFFFLPGAFHMMHHFSSIPREMSIVGDRLFYAALRLQPLVTAVVAKPTVNYHCLWIPVYRAVGEVPPAGSKPAADSTVAMKWLATRSPREKRVISRLTGVPWT